MNIQDMVGVWTGDDGSISSNVITKVLRSEESLYVEQLETASGENAIITNIYWGAKTLKFDAFWKSTGRFNQCVMEFKHGKSVNYYFSYRSSTLCIKQDNDAKTKSDNHLIYCGIWRQHEDPNHMDIAISYHKTLKIAVDHLVEGPGVVSNIIWNSISVGFKVDWPTTGRTYKCLLSYFSECILHNQYEFCEKIILLRQ
ncbi:MAG: hypothetical protein ACO1QB_11040 [Verrucomicrobiales bacterium]